jgi:nucleoid DNA-binding protein
MIKVDIINEVSATANITKVKAEQAVEAVLDAMKNSMQRGERIELRGFGVFQVKPRKRGIGRNPRTGKEVRFLVARSVQAGEGSAEHPESEPLIKHLSLVSGSRGLGPPPPSSPHVLSRRSRSSRPRVLVAGLLKDVSTSGNGDRLRALQLHLLGHLSTRWDTTRRSLPWTRPSFFFRSFSHRHLQAFYHHLTSHRKALIDMVSPDLRGFLVAFPRSSSGFRLAADRLSSRNQHRFVTLLFQWFSTVIWPNLPENYDLYISPIGLAAWFGLLLTALNLIPIGQLDGGHASYALLRNGAHRLSAWAFFGFLPMTYFGPSWLFWALLLYLLGIRRPHPPTRIDDLSPPRSRYVMGLVALLVFVLCFTPEPIVVDWATSGPLRWLAS